MDLVLDIRRYHAMAVEEPAPADVVSHLVPI